MYRNDEITGLDVLRLDPQRKSVWLRDGRRIGFAQARRAGLDVEALLERWHVVNASARRAS